MPQIQYQTTQSIADLRQILALQHLNHFSQLSLAAKAEQGFVTVKHDLAQLEEMAAALPQFIAAENHNIVGYVLSMNFEMRTTIPTLAPLFDELDHFSYQNVPLSKQNFVVCGQTCISKNFRGMGIMQQLYLKMKTTLCLTYKGCITEISALNIPSLKAHGKIGFNTIHRYHDGEQEWHIVLWEWN